MNLCLIEHWLALTSELEVTLAIYLIVIFIYNTSVLVSVLRETAMSGVSYEYIYLGNWFM